MLTSGSVQNQSSGRGSRLQARGPLSTLPGALFTGLTVPSDPTLRHGPFARPAPPLAPAPAPAAPPWQQSRHQARRCFSKHWAAGGHARTLPVGWQLPVLGRGVDVPRGHDGFWVVPIVLLGVRGVVGLAAAELHARDDGALELAGGVGAGAPAAGHDADEGAAHLLVGERVDDGVGARVEHRQHQEVLGLEEDVTGPHLAAHVQQQQDEERRPAGDEDAQHDDHRLEQRQRLLRAAARLGRVLAEGQAAAARAHQRVDAAVEDDDGEQQHGEDRGAEEDIVLVVERQHRGAAGQQAEAVPAHDGQAAQHQRDDPAGADEQEGARAAALVVQLHLQHGDVALDGDGQQAEHGRGQRHEHAALAQEPLRGRQVVGVGPGEEQVHDVGHPRQQVREGQVADEVVHGPVELLGFPDGQEDEDVLQDDAAADEDEHHGRHLGAAVLVLAQVQLPRVVVMPDDDVIVGVVGEGAAGGPHGAPRSPEPWPRGASPADARGRWRARRRRGAWKSEVPAFRASRLDRASGTAALKELQRESGKPQAQRILAEALLVLFISLRETWGECRERDLKKSNSHPLQKKNLLKGRRGRKRGRENNKNNGPN